MFDTAESSSLADRRADATRDAIVDAAWQLSREQGLTGWSLRELARAVGVKAPTLYAYVDSKLAIYDLMFRQGWDEMNRVAARWSFADPDGDHRRAFKRSMQGFMAFCTSDPTRYHLMFQRIVPDFSPSETAYAASVASYEQFRAHMAEIGITDDADLDLWTAISVGLTDQQITNDPGGDRWTRLLDAAVDMFCDHVGIPDATTGGQIANNRQTNHDREQRP
ncbi:MAG: TetR/AcrR family transcriptional regulator [Ilumatobacter sp.]|nr:TetR/AcrR family transcriptional regulator [Ilumatobacter sp.]